MPNIEIHGLTEREAAKLTREIFGMFREKSYADEMVVTFYPTKVVDKNWKSQPFIRLANSCQEHTQEILERLQILNIDIEHLALVAFIPKKPSSPVVKYFINEKGLPAFLHEPKKIENALRRAGIMTIEELDKLSGRDFQNIRNLGAKGIAIILAEREARAGKKNS